MADDRMVRPVTGAKLVDTFGAARSGGRKHQGIDIFADSGTPIHAISGGKIVRNFEGGPLGGVVVRIEGDDGRYYYYAHLKDGSTDGLKPGQRVEAGDVIGQVGNTGNARTTPAHLHFQVQQDGEWINPYDFLKPLPELDGAGAVPGVADAFAIDPGRAPADVSDADHDGLTDAFERLFGTSASAADTDRDGLSDAYETATSHTDPLSADTDRDGLTDGFEVAHGSDAGRGAIPDAVRAGRFGGLATLDTDKDGLSDLYEHDHGSNPLLADSDSDGLSDSFEAARGSNPASADTDLDGLTDSFEAEAGTLEAAPAAPGGAQPFGAPVGQGLGVPADPDLDDGHDHTDDALGALDPSDH